MRRRLVASFVGLTALAIVLYGVPRAWFVVDLVHSSQQEVLERSADLTSLLLDEHPDHDAAATGALLQQAVSPGDVALYTTVDGTTVRAGDAPAAGGDSLSATRAVASGGTLVLLRSQSELRARVVDALTPLVLLGVSLLPVAAGAAPVLARRLSRPFQSLAVAAGGLGRGDFRIPPARSSVPEADAIAQALQDSGQRLEVMLARERSFAEVASHELRTPLTALRLDLEDLALWGETPPAVAAQLRSSLGEVDRLSAAITTLLERSDLERTRDAQDLDLEAVVAHAVTRWQAATGGKPQVVHSSSGALPVHLPRVALEQTLDALISSALGAAKRPTAAGDRPGQVRLTTIDAGSHARIEVTCEGDTGQAAWGADVAGARELASLFDGRVVTAMDDRAAVSLIVPVGEPDAPSP